MKNNARLTRELSIYAALASISALLQLVHIGIQTHWGMWIDLVAVTWIIAYFLFGFRGAILVAVVGSIIITLFDPSTWLGATAKFLATLPMFFTPFLFEKMFRLKRDKFSSLKFLVPSIILALIIRVIIIIPFDYFVAIPIWVEGMSIKEIIKAFPWYVLLYLNLIQGIIDVVFAWLIVFPSKLSRFANWQ